MVISILLLVERNHLTNSAVGTTLQSSSVQSSNCYYYFRFLAAILEIRYNMASKKSGIAVSESIVVENPVLVFERSSVFSRNAIALRTIGIG